jgi:hypothetical protein
MRRLRARIGSALVLLVAVACATTGGQAPSPTSSVEAMGKVVDSLADEAARRAADESFRGLPIVVVPASTSGNALELVIAEFLRTRLLERDMVVQTACGARCLEIGLREFETSAPAANHLTPGQILTVATGSVPILGNLVKNLSEHDREAQRAAAHTTGLLVTFSARDGERYTARGHVIAIVSAGGGDVALERK